MCHRVGYHLMGPPSLAVRVPPPLGLYSMGSHLMKSYYQELEIKRKISGIVFDRLRMKFLSPIGLNQV